MSVYIFGDSITRGHFGIGYVHYLDSSFITKGWDGATLEQILSFSKHHMKKVDSPHPSIIFQGGANDLLYTYLSTHSNGWNEYVENKRNSKHSSPNLWKEDVIKQLRKLQERHPNFSFFLCNIAIEAPFARQELLSLTHQYNSAIDEIGKELAIEVIDLFGQYKERLEGKSVSDYMPENNDKIEEDAIFIEGDEQKAAQLSLSRSLILTTDGIHPNKDGASCIAKAIHSLSFM